MNETPNLLAFLFDNKKLKVNIVKKYLKRLAIFPVLRKLYRIANRIPRHPIQDSKSIHGFNIIHLGSEYGGWSFVDEDYLYNSIIISAGLGEDASFDIEFATKYNAKVIIIDPTPRALKHFKDIQSSLGKASSEQYTNNGCQPITSYELSNLNKDNLVLIECALWNENTTVKFFSPPNPKDVSHSIINYQNNYSTETASINVNALTLDTILKNLKLKASDIPLIKLDIEGAEIEVLRRCLEVGILPRQILVEFDELNEHRGFERVTWMNQILKNNGYILIETNGIADFLYIRR